MIRRLFSALLVLLISFGWQSSSLAAEVFPANAPQPLQLVRLISYAGGGWNLPIWCGERQGFFLKRGLDVRLDYAPSSKWQLTHLLSGDYESAICVLDNIIAYDEGQGEAYIPKDVLCDFIAILGTDNGFLSLSAQPPIKSIADLKGKTLTCNPMTSGFTIIFRELLARNGVSEDSVKFIRAGGVYERYEDMLAHPDHAATMETTPFELMGEAHGFHTLVRAEDVFGKYQGVVAAVRRSWAEKNRDTAVKFIAAYQESMDWMYDPQNRSIVEAILIAHIRGLTPEVASKAYDVFTSDKGGFFRKIEPDIEGIRTVLKLRTKYGIPHKELTDPYKYVDLSYYREATAKR